MADRDKARFERNQNLIACMAAPPTRAQLLARLDEELNEAMPLNLMNAPRFAACGWSALSCARSGAVRTSRTGDDDSPFVMPCIPTRAVKPPPGPSRDWLKLKNPDSPAMARHWEDRW
jgi:hypothetical protein